MLALNAGKLDLHRPVSQISVSAGIIADVSTADVPKTGQLAHEGHGWKTTSTCFIFGWLNACAAINTHLLSVWSLAGYVEVLASKLGMQVPDLTPKQVDMWQTRLSSHMVRFFLWVLFLNPLHVLIRSGNKRGMMGRKRKQEFMLLYLRASRVLHFCRLLNKVLIIISCTYHNR